MSFPKVSICLPNLNNRKFLEERLDTIVSQSFMDWELVVSDNFSDDGAWEFFQEKALLDRRMRIEQAQRAGMYSNWNRCVNRACGEYVYIATSDDTMSGDCIEKLVEALDTHPDCDLAHCGLRIIDEAGNESDDDWWASTSMFARSSGPLREKMHIRKAPFDGFLHLSGQSVFISITQLLIRRSLFARIGVFEPRWGSIGDFAWNMSASLVANVVHVPSTWGSWRTHAGQATAAARLGSLDHLHKIDEMIADSLEKAAACEPRPAWNVVRSEWEAKAADLRRFYAKLRNTRSFVERQAYILRRLLSGSAAARNHIASKVDKQGCGIEALIVDGIRTSVERATGESVFIARE